MNLYHDGNEGIGWHSDDEKSIGDKQHKQSKKIILILLEHVSLLLMKDATQKNWLHSLPKSSKLHNQE